MASTTVDALVDHETKLAYDDATMPRLNHRSAKMNYDVAL